MIRYDWMSGLWILTLDGQQYEFSYLVDVLAFVCQSGAAS
jgi:hypothetical protein